MATNVAYDFSIARAAAHKVIFCRLGASMTAVKSAHGFIS
jgi:hypothetical protein